MMMNYVFITLSRQFEYYDNYSSVTCSVSVSFVGERGTYVQLSDEWFQVSSLFVIYYNVHIFIKLVVFF